VLGTVEVGNGYPRNGTDGGWKIAGRDAIFLAGDGPARLIDADGDHIVAGEPQEPTARTALRDALDHWRRGAAPPISVHDLLPVVTLIDQAYALAGPPYPRAPS
jgi:hypothetical protein